MVIFLFPGYKSVLFGARIVLDLDAGRRDTATAVKRQGLCEDRQHFGSQ